MSMREENTNLFDLTENDEQGDEYHEVGGSDMAKIKVNFRM